LGKRYGLGFLPEAVFVNIGLIVYGTLDTPTGGYLYDRRLVAHLRSSAHRVDVFSLPARGYGLRWLDNFAVGRLSRFCGTGFDLLLQDELCHPSLLVLNRRRGARKGPPTVAIVHHLYCAEPRPGTFNFFLRLIEKCYLDTVDGFIFNSRTTKKMVFRLSRRPRPHVVAPPGGNRFGGRITAAEVADRARRPGPLQLLYVGLVIPRKGLLELISALRRVPTDRWQLEIVGSLTIAPGYVRRVRNYVQAHRLWSSVRFHGTIGNEDLAAEFAAAQVLCMPYAYEGFGIVAAEAMTMGLPVLGSTSGAMGELIEHGVTGLLFSRNDVQSVAAAAAELYADRPCLARMGLAALCHSQRHLTWRQSMQDIETFLGQFRLKKSNAKY
jgi:glycosyltransferase involved in cell wall biosynthesis